MHPLKNNITLDNVSIKNNSNTNSMFAMYVQDGDEYIEYNETNTFPDGYELNLEKSKCIDNDGTEITDILSKGENNKVIVNTNKSVYCYLYFDGDFFSGTGKDLIDYQPSGLSTNLLGDMYRFVGTKDTVDNYVCFGYSNATNDCKDSTNDYSYRIIGITPDGKMKLIKNTAIREGTEETNKYYLWWWEDYTTDKIWPSSKIYPRLNGQGSGTTIGDSGVSNLFINSTTSNVTYLTTGSNWYNKIENRNWMYGSIYKDSLNTTANKIYEYENGKVAVVQNYNETAAKWKNSITARVGLMSVSDYYYSYATNGTDSSMTNCYSGTANCNNSWLHISQNGYSDDDANEWTMTSYGHDSFNYYYEWEVMSSGNMSLGYYTYKCSIRPVFFLTLEASQISKGKGTSSNPFVIAK